jgi:DNA replication protein DnaC
MNSGLLNENSTYEDFKKLISFDWSDYRGKDENGNLKKLQKFVDEFDSKDKPFKNLHCYVWGNQGTQKSYTLKGMLSKLACKGKQVYYIFAKELIDLIFDSDREEDAKKKLDYIMNVDVLVIDEFDQRRIASWKSGYKENMLLVPLKNRLEIIKKSTWIISNCGIEEQKDSSFGELYYDLLKRETCYGQFNFTDRYFDSLSKEEIEEKLKSIWDD